ncbi:MAG: hypothetical protein FWB71_04350 [Defluviitaleaceae bacterium]|nr:hypothetical protein [Defluviitaleaceae bacterium]
MKHKRLISKFLAILFIFGAVAGFGVQNVAAAVIIEDRVSLTAGSVRSVSFDATLPAGAIVSGVWAEDGGSIAMSNIFPGVQVGQVVNITADISAPAYLSTGAFSAILHFQTSLGSFVGGLTVDVAGLPPGTPGTTTPIPANVADIRMDAPIPYLTPGVASTITITLRNNNAHLARNITLSNATTLQYHLEILDPAPFSLGNRQSRDIQIRITPHHTITATTLTIPLQITFEDNQNNVHSPNLNVLARLTVPERPEPDLRMTNYFVLQENVRAGESFEITTVLNNIGSGDARNVSVNIGELPLRISLGGTPSMHFIGEIPAGSMYSVTFGFTAAADLPAGTHRIPLVVRHDDSSGPVAPITLHNHVTIIGEGAVSADNRARLDVDSISRPSGNFAPGAEVRFDLVLRNNGEVAASNITVESSLGAHIVPIAQYRHNIPIIEPGETATISFVFAARDTATSQFHLVGFSWNYNTGIGEARGSNAATSGFMVNNPDDAENGAAGIGSIPRIIVSNHTVEPMIVMANSEFDLFLTFQNTHSSRTISNIRVNMQVLGQGTAAGGGGVFVPIGGASNTFHIEEIAPRETYDRHIRMSVIPIAEPRNHIITITFQYEDDAGNPHTAVEEIGVNVRQNSRVEIGHILVQDTWMLGMPSMIDFVVHNSGRSRVYNVRSVIEVDGIVQSDHMFGNINSGMGDFYWGQLTSHMPGQSSVRIIISFEDEVGNLHEIIREYPINVIQMDWGDGGGGGPIWGDPGDRWPWDDYPYDEEGGFFANFIGSVWMWVAIGVIACGGITAVAIIVSKRRRKALFEFEED